jgi:hypothetical protein
MTKENLIKQKEYFEKLGNSEKLEKYLQACKVAGVVFEEVKKGVKK